VVALLLVIVLVVTVVRSVSSPDKTIEVYAASSLRHAFPDVAAAFEDEEDVAVDVTYGSSGTLVARLGEKTSPDVLAVADGTALFQANPVLTGEPMVLTQNRLVLVVPEGNPEDAEAITDLDGAGIAMCHINAPCGRLAQLAVEAAGLEVQPVVADDAAGTLQLVLDGHAQAGLVYATDALAAEDEVEMIEVPASSDRVNFYGVSLLTGATDPEEGQEFIDFVLGDAGQEILEEHGFATADNPHLQPED
jgi:molybdate transport system substrate-binding protein